MSEQEQISNLTRQNEDLLRILRIVRAMRIAQRQFFGGTQSEKRRVIQLAKQLEREVDQELEDTFAEAQQESLF